jgi:predicted amidophosphoribosyltransferase
MDLSQLGLSQLKFGALLTYAPHGDSLETRHSKDVMFVLKRDGYVGKQKILMSEWIAQTIQRRIIDLPFASFFQSNTILVPTPKSSLMKPNSLWVPQRIATALVRVGLGKDVSSCLVRNKAVPKAAFCAPSDRPTAAQHYESMGVQGSLSNSDEILLIDDVVTRGATLLGAANRLAQVFPQSRIRAFAAMRTISNPSEFEKVYNPCIGTIDLWESGDTYRRP